MVKVELKYCETCGGLWLRKTGTNDSDCTACEARWHDLPMAWSGRLATRSRDRRLAETRRVMEIEAGWAFAAIEGTSAAAGGLA